MEPWQQYFSKSFPISLKIQVGLRTTEPKLQGVSGMSVKCTFWGPSPGLVGLVKVQKLSHRLGGNASNGAKEKCVRIPALGGKLKNQDYSDVSFSYLY